MANNEGDESNPALPMTQMHFDGERHDSLHQRQLWSRHLDYLLTMVGYCVGLGNLLRFPYICSRNGGGAFLFPFILCLLITGFPMFFLESALSQFSGKATPQVWSFCPLLKGVGIGAGVLIYVLMPYYNLYLAWSIYYMVKSCSSVLPWTNCGNDWNTDLCVETVITTHTTNMTAHTTNMTSLSANTSDAVTELWENVTLAHTPAEEFWQYNALSVSSGLEDVGFVQWHIVGCLLGSVAIIFLCLVRGVKSSGKVVYVTALLPYALLIAIFIVTLFQPGALGGIIFYVVPDFTKLLDLQVWIEACLQVFYSLGPGFGGVGTAASYKKFHLPCLRDCLILCIISEGTSIFSGLVTFAVLGSMAQKLRVPIGKVVSTGPGLGFVTYPEALSQLPLPQLWSFLFFLMLLLIGLDSQFVCMEVAITALVDEYPRQLGKRRLIVTGCCCLVIFLFGIVFCTQGGPYMFQLIDWYIASLGPMVFCTLECVAVMWIYGAKRFSSDVQMMTGKHLSPAVKVLLAFVTPAILVIVLTLTIISYQPPTYGKYVFPSYANAIGWCFAVLCLLPLPVSLVIAVRKHRAKGSLKKSVILALKPDEDWGPADASYKEVHKIYQQTQRHTFKDNILDILK